MDSEMLRAALALAARGFYVLPCRERGKVPLTRDGFKSATTDEATIRRWWTRFPAANIGLAPGISGYCVIDIDGEEGRVTATRLGLLPIGTLSVQTGRSGTGLHLYFARPDFHVGNARLGAGIDVRCDAGYVVAPPSIHPSGHAYSWGTETKAVQLPQPVLELLRVVGKNPGSADIESPPKSPGITRGRRNNTLTSVAGVLRRYGADEKAIGSTLRLINTEICSPPLPRAETDSIARSVAKYAIENIPHEPLTDLGNAKRFVHLFGNDVRFAQGPGWLRWDGTRWEPDTSGTIMQLAKAAALSIHGEAESATENQQSALRKWANASQSLSRLRAMAELALSEPPIRIDVSQLDAHPLLLNLANGTWDMRHSALRPHDRADLLTKLSPARYEPNAKAPLWEEMLNRVFAQDAELIRYVQLAFGYAATGEATEHSVFLFLGSGANGKTTVLEAIRHALGEYSLSMDFGTLTAKHDRGGPTPEIARLRGARFVTATEAEQGERFREATLKKLTGGDTISARGLYRDSVDFRPTFTLFLSVNHLPALHGSDEGIWRRIKIIPFDVTIPQEQRDRTLTQRLTSEVNGIIRWILEGTAAWLHHGLPHSAAVTKATMRYRRTEDNVPRFVEECCERGAQFTTDGTVLFEAYTGWCGDEGVRAVSHDAFSKRLTALGFGKTRGGLPDRKYQRIGLRLRDEAF